VFKHFYMTLTFSPPQRVRVPKEKVKIRTY